MKEMEGKKFFIGGAHRGGEAIVAALDSEATQGYRECLISDPIGNRADTLGKRLAERFPSMSVSSIAQKAQDALKNRPEDTLVLAMDTVGDIRATLNEKKPKQQAHFQILGKEPGPNENMFAIQGTLQPLDREAEKNATILLTALERSSVSASSRLISEPDPLASILLNPMRREAAKITARNLALKDRDPWDIEGGPLKFLNGARTFPLVPVAASLSRFSEINDLSLETASKLPFKVWGAEKMLVVALIAASRVDFATVRENSIGKRTVHAIRTLSAPAAMFTD